MMYKIIITLVLACNLSLYTYAQGNQIEAKAAYLLAEESFAKGDYEATLNYLKSAAKNLGATNSKMLYLQIQTELELYKKDSTYYSQVLKSISEFQNSADVNSFTEEKVVDIAKTKMQLVKDREEEIKNKEIKRLQSEKIENYNFDDWPLNIPFDELKVIKKDHRFFKRKTITYAAKSINNGLGKSNLTFHFPNGSDAYNGNPLMLKNNYFYLDDVIVMLVENNKVKGYRRAIYAKSSDTKDISKAESMDEVKNIVAKWTAYFGFEPTYREADEHRSSYTWFNGNKAISLFMVYGYNADGYWHNWVTEEILEN